MSRAPSRITCSGFLWPKTVFLNCWQSCPSEAIWQLKMAVWAEGRGWYLCSSRSRSGMLLNALWYAQDSTPQTELSSLKYQWLWGSALRGCDTSELAGSPRLWSVWPTSQRSDQNLMSCFRIYNETAPGSPPQGVLWSPSLSTPPSECPVCSLAPPPPQSMLLSTQSMALPPWNLSSLGPLIYWCVSLEFSKMSASVWQWSIIIHRKMNNPSSWMSNICRWHFDGVL